jgi:predicted nucleic acid-binding protein
VIILDTNVLSALMRREPDTVVVAWLDRQPSESVWTTAITVFEIRFGLELLPPGRRRRQLEDAFTRALAEDFCSRILPFDDQAAAAAASCAAACRAAGKSVDFRDVEIAGIVSVRRATLATRNVRHFTGLGITLANPWERS